MNFIYPFSFFEIAMKLNTTPINKKIEPISTINSEYPSINQFAPKEINPNTIKKIDHLLNNFIIFTSPNNFTIL